MFRGVSCRSPIFIKCNPSKSVMVTLNFYFFNYLRCREDVYYLLLVTPTSTAEREQNKNGFGPPLACTKWTKYLGQDKRYRSTFLFFIWSNECAGARQCTVTHTFVRAINRCIFMRNVTAITVPCQGLERIRVTSGFCALICLLLFYRTFRAISTLYWDVKG